MMTENPKCYDFRKWEGFIGIFVGVLFTLAVLKIWNSTDFFRYLYLCLKNYDGTIPPYLFDEPTSDLGITGDTQSDLSDASSWTMLSTLCSYAKFW
jgi:hypothetical protein